MSAFATTHWSLLLAARNDDARAGAALAQICARYRAPVLSYMRIAGHSLADAEDLTQAFFVRFLEKRSDHAADPARGRFRQLLRVQLRHFLIDTRASAAALKRGGGRRGEADFEFEAIADPGLAPEQAFDRSFALAVVDRALARLREEISVRPRRELFDALAPSLFEPRDPGVLKVIAQAHGMRENALAVTLKRLRDRLALQIRTELSELIDASVNLDDEVRALRSALRD